MRFTSTHGSDRSEEGWLVLDIRNVDLEGVSQIYVSLADVRELKRQWMREARQTWRNRAPRLAQFPGDAKQRPAAHGIPYHRHFNGSMGYPTTDISTIMEMSLRGARARRG